jgi:hypothetical protein
MNGIKEGNVCDTRAPVDMKESTRVGMKYTDERIRDSDKKGKRKGRVMHISRNTINEQRREERKWY